MQQENETGFNFNYAGNHLIVLKRVLYFFPSGSYQQQWNALILHSFRQTAEELHLFRSLSLVLFLLMLVVSGCERKAAVPINPVDLTTPFYSAFWGKGVRYMLTEDFEGGYDTTEFDRSGNVIYFEEYWHKEWKSYDNVHRLVRSLIRTDITDNVIIAYSIRGDSLIETWSRLGGSRWELTREDSVPQSSWQVVSRFDGQGHIVSKAYDGGVRFDYTYNEKGLLAIANSPQDSTTYQYDDTGHLSEIVSKSPKGDSSTHYFNLETGLPDFSAVMVKDRFRTIHYRYIMY